MTMQTSLAARLCRQAGLGWNEAGDATALAWQLAEALASVLQRHIENHGAATLVVSGGSTPEPVFRSLSGLAIDWSCVTVTLADERWVPPGHADSNETFVRDTLLSDKAAAAGFVPLYHPGITPEAAVEPVTTAIRAMVQPPTCVVLGMGSDGHTASLFPDAPEHELRAAMRLDKGNDVASVAVLHPPSVAQVRITLTRSLLLKGLNRYLHITGENKLNVLGDALAASADTDPSRAGPWRPGLKPIVGLLTTEPKKAHVYYAP